MKKRLSSFFYLLLVAIVLTSLAGCRKADFRPPALSPLQQEFALIKDSFQLRGHATRLQQSYKNGRMIRWEPQWQSVQKKKAAVMSFYYVPLKGILTDADGKELSDYVVFMGKRYLLVAEFNGSYEYTDAFFTETAASGAKGKDKPYNHVGNFMLKKAGLQPVKQERFFNSFTGSLYASSLDKPGIVYSYDFINGNPVKNEATNSTESGGGSWQNKCITQYSCGSDYTYQSGDSFSDFFIDGILPFVVITPCVRADDAPNPLPCCAYNAAGEDAMYDLIEDGFVSLMEALKGPLLQVDPDFRLQVSTTFPPYRPLFEALFDRYGPYWPEAMQNGYYINTADLVRTAGYAHSAIVSETRQCTAVWVDDPHDPADDDPGGGGGGGGGSDDPQQGDPCATVKAKTAEPAYKAKAQELEGNTSFTYETGYEETKDGNFIALSNHSSTALTDELGINPTGNTKGFIHTHLDDYEIIDNQGNTVFSKPIRMFSPRDVDILMELVNHNQLNGDLSSYYISMVTSRGHYMIKFTGTTADIKMGFNTREWERKYIDYMKDYDNLEKGFLKFLKEEMGIKGVSLYKIKNNGSVNEKKLNSSDKLTTSPC